MNVAIVGAGKLGIKVCNALLNGNYNITLMDTDDVKLEKESMYLDVLALNMDARNIGSLKEAGIGEFDYLLAVTGDDETNIIVAAFAKKLGCKTVIARIRDPEYMKHPEFIRETMNIDYIINPDLAITMEIYKYLIEKYSLSNGIFSTGRISLIEFEAESMKKLIGLSMIDVKKELPDMLVGAISRNGKVIIPHGDDVIKADDSLYIVGAKHSILELNKSIRVRKYKKDVQKVMIIGGGKTGYYLAEKLSEFGASVKIVEKKEKRCRYLSTRMKNVMVLHGDGTDMAMLEEENIDDMDAFVSVTDYDEENLLLALAAKDRGIEDVISKVSRASYIDLTEKLGIDMVLNPLDITAGRTFCIIQEEKRVISSTLIQGQAEIVEICPTRSMKITGIPLKNLVLPDGVIIAAIHRNGKVIIPDGDTKIELDDRVIIFCLLTAISDLEKLIKNK